MTRSTTFQTHAARDLIDGLEELATACARYGITLARASVEACARGLDHLAERLGQIAEGLKPTVVEEEAAATDDASPAPTPKTDEPTAAAATE